MYVDSSLVNGGSIAIIVDIYKYKNDKVISNILKKVPNIPNLTAVILSTYDANDAVTNLYYRNSKDIFLNSQPLPGIQEHYRQVTKDYTGTRKTDPKILEKVWGCPQYAMFDELQLEHYINHIVPHVNHIYFLGTSWTSCVKNRRMGWKNISKLIKFNHINKDINLYTIDGCVSSEWNNNKEVFPNLLTDPYCERIEKDIFVIKWT